MLFFDKDASTIETICRSIDKNIERINDRGLLAQNIVMKLRHLVEATSVFIYNSDKNENLEVEYSNYNIETALNYISSKGNYRFLKEFHDGVQVSLSHYHPNEDEAIRLMEKYYYKLVMLKKVLEEKYNLKVLDRIYEYPIEMDSTYHDYYSVIIPIINRCDRHHGYYAAGRYYVQKIKPIIWNKLFYYEITLSPANDKTSKFSRIVVFSRKYISTDYSIKAKIINVPTNIYGKRVVISVMTDYSISIRPCEINNLGKIFGLHLRISGNYNEYKDLMQFLTIKRINLLDICSKKDEDIQKEYSALNLNYLRTLLDSASKIIVADKSGSNVLRYLLYTMRNKVIKDQTSDFACGILSNLFLDIKCDRFDKLPYTMNLCNHRPSLDDLYKSIDPTYRHDELLARRLIMNSEVQGEIYTSISEIILDDNENLNEMVQKYNSKQYYKHKENHIVSEHGQLYIREYEEGCISILHVLNNLSCDGLYWYPEYADRWLKEKEPNISNDKKEIIKQLFGNSKVALIYGAAGTGKTTIIKTMADMLCDESILFLATTSTAVNNLKRMIDDDSFEYKTIANYLKIQNKHKYDLLVIDECSTTGNIEIRKILMESNYDKLLLVGDTYQLESIDFGNWFMMARNLMEKRVWYELDYVHRTDNEKLLKLWDLVRHENHRLIDFMSKNSFNHPIGGDIMDSFDEDEIILCLNYDGIFGINNINSILQSKNSGKEVQFGISLYKVGDPIVFNESKIFGDVLYNNLKAIITDIIDTEDKVYFEVMAYANIRRYEIESVGADYLGEKDENTLVGFSVKKMTDTDEDDRDEMVVPFNVAYAMSIYKAQGLEYNSVKVVIPNDIDELVTPNAFYTAITRAKRSLKIYWSAETQHRITSRLRFAPSNKVLNILKGKI